MLLNIQSKSNNLPIDKSHTIHFVEKDYSTNYEKELQNNACIQNGIAWAYLHLNLNLHIAVLGATKGT